MSLINDALKRAKHAQQNHAATIPVGPLVQAAHRAPSSSGSWPVITLALIVGILMTLSGLLVWQLTAREPVRVIHAPGISTPAQAASVGIPAVAGRTDSASAAILSEEPIAPPADSTPALPDARGPALEGETSPNASVSEPAPPPAPPALKLQGLVYRPGGSSAVVNGKTVYVGDRVLDAQVLAIDKETVMLNRNGQKVVLRLD